MATQTLISQVKQCLDRTVVWYSALSAAARTEVHTHDHEGYSQPDARKRGLDAYMDLIAFNLGEGLDSIDDDLDTPAIRALIVQTATVLKQLDA